MNKPSALLLVPGIVLAASPRHLYRAWPVASPRETRGIAEAETGGIAVSARRIPLNGATGGWEVEVRMPREARGWKCIIDSDTRSVFRRERIPNPPPSRRTAAE
jgi:hypothetical protein